MYWYGSFKVAGIKGIKEDQGDQRETYHLLDRIESVDVKEVPPPVVGAVVVIGSGRLEDRIRMEPLHGYLGDAEDEHVGGGEPAEPVSEEAEELEEAGDEAPRALGKPVEVALRVRAEVQEADEEAAHEEEGVDAEGAVLDRLEQEPLLHDLPVLHVVRVLEDDDAGVPEDDPSHRDRAQPVDGADGVATYLALADHPEVGSDREGEQQLLPHACERGPRFARLVGNSLALPLSPPHPALYPAINNAGSMIRRYSCRDASFNLFAIRYDTFQQFHTTPITRIVINSCAYILGVSFTVNFTRAFVIQASRLRHAFNIIFNAEERILLSLEFSFFSFLLTFLSIRWIFVAIGTEFHYVTLFEILFFHFLFVSFFFFFLSIL
jgi:hypothetical protein